MTLLEHFNECREEGREEGIEIGREEGIEKNLVSNIRALLGSSVADITVDEAFDLFQVPEEKRERLKELILSN